jgi:hypothetical protein
MSDHAGFTTGQCVAVDGGWNYRKDNGDNLKNNSCLSKHWD